MAPRPRLGQINLVVRDMGATIEFYTAVGLQIEAVPGSHHVEVSLEPGVRLEFDTAESVALWDARWDGRTGGAAVLGLHFASRAAVDEVFSALTAAGHTGHQPPHDAFWGARYAIVDDPDGYAVGLMSPIDDARRHWPPAPPPALL
jgi:uncharacterized glyoxalase superfamily protein PhnB